MVLGRERQRNYFLDCHLCNVYRFILVFGEPDCPYLDHVVLLIDIVE